MNPEKRFNLQFEPQMVIDLDKSFEKEENSLNDEVNDEATINT